MFCRPPDILQYAHIALCNSTQQGCGASWKWNCYSSRAFPFHERGSVFNFRALGFNEYRSNSGALRFHNTTPTSGFVRFHTLTCFIVLENYRVHKIKWICRLSGPQPEGQPDDCPPTKLSKICKVVRYINLQSFCSPVSAGCGLPLIWCASNLLGNEKYLVYKIETIYHT